MRAADYSRLNVLYAHGNQPIVPIIRNFLHAMSVRQVCEVPDAMHAISRLNETECDLAIIDLDLGQIDGAELVQLIRTDNRSPNPCMPIIMISSFAERLIVENAIRAGVDAFLVTPISHQDLQQRINWVMENPRSLYRRKNNEGADPPVRNDRDLAEEDQRECLEI